MKHGISLAQLAGVIKSTSQDRKDFMVPTDALRYEPNDGFGTIAFQVGSNGNEYEASPNRYCLRQICERSGIPSKYADRMMEKHHSELLSHNINYWWQHEPEKRMLRTLMNEHDHVARAFLSSSYRPLENADLAAIVLPKLADLDCEVLSCEVTESRLYIQAATPRIQAKAVGDVVQAGIVVSNSEVGAGALALDPLLYYLRCLNGMIMPRALGRYHIGRKNDPMYELDSAAEYYSDKTKEMDDRAFWAKVSDVVTGLFDKDRFNSMVAAFQGAQDQRIKGTDAVEEITRRFDLNTIEKDAVLNHLIEGGELNLFGLVNAVTATASDVESYDRSIDLQRIGGRILELPKSTWN
jgi:hypothetical protein